MRRSTNRTGAADHTGRSRSSTSSASASAAAVVAVMECENWDGSPAVLLSRATDESGNVQPSRAAFLAERGAPKVTPNVAAFPKEHCNMISSWGVSAKGEVTNVYV